MLWYYGPHGSSCATRHLGSVAKLNSFFPRTCLSVRAPVSPEARLGVCLPREPRDLSCRRAEWPALLLRVVAGHLWASVNSPCTRVLSVGSARGPTKLILYHALVWKAERVANCPHAIPGNYAMCSPSTFSNDQRKSRTHFGTQ